MSKIIKNLEEFLKWRGFGEDEACTWARCFYKYTACGPWAAFVMLECPARTVEYPSSVAVVRHVRGQAKLKNPEELDDEFVQFLGFDERGLSKKERTWDNYVKLVKDFIEDEAKQKGNGRTIRVERLTIAELRIERLPFSREIPEVTRDIYYGDIGKQVYKDETRMDRCYCTFADGGPHPDDPQETVYARQEADPDCPRCSGAGEYEVRVPDTYTDEEGRVRLKSVTVDHDHCVGVKIGSIVEGSDAYSGPFEFRFPFDSEEFDKAVAYMERETSFYWERDNSQWLALIVGDRVYYLHDTWGDITWDGDKPSRRLRKKVEDFVREHSLEIPAEPGLWARSNPDWKPLRIPGTRADIYETINDSTFY